MIRYLPGLGIDNEGFGHARCADLAADQLQVILEDRDRDRILSGIRQWSRQVQVSPPAGASAASGIIAGGVAANAVSVVALGAVWTQDVVPAIATADIDGTPVTSGYSIAPSPAQWARGFVYAFAPRGFTMGNSVLDPGEQCDSGTCCSAFARFVAAGVVCGPGAMCTGTSQECVVVCGNGTLDPGEQCN